MSLPGSVLTPILSWIFFLLHCPFCMILIPFPEVSSKCEVLSCPKTAFWVVTFKHSLKRPFKSLLPLWQLFTYEIYLKKKKKKTSEDSDIILNLILFSNVVHLYLYQYRYIFISPERESGILNVL